MWRFTPQLIAWSLLAASVQAQQAPPDPATVMQYLDKQVAPLANAWLNSADARTRAWGAYVVLRDWHTELIPDLESMLRAHRAVEQAGAPVDAEEHFVMLGVLDALIEFGAEVPASEARRIYDEFPAQSLILLARSQEDAMPALLDIFGSKRHRPPAWLAAGNVLFQHRAAGFASLVVENLTVHALAIVADSNSGGGTGGSSSCCGAGYPPPKAGWPPLGVYAFGGCGNNVQPGAIMLAAGPDPAYYYRQVNTSYQANGSGCCNLDLDLVSQHYLTALLSDSSEQPSVRAHISHTIAWRGPDEYRGELAAFIGEQQHLFDALARRLANLGLISNAEADTLRPALEIRVSDIRASHDIALPAFSWSAGKVTVEPL